MNATSIDIKDILEAESSLGLAFGTNLFIGKEPATPVNCVTIFDTVGGLPQLTLAKGEDYYYCGIQMRVRDVNYINGWSLITDIRTILHGRGPETWNGTLYTVIRAINEPALLDYDEKDRPRFVVTFEGQRR